MGTIQQPLHKVPARPRVVSKVRMKLDGVRAAGGGGKSGESLVRPSDG
jgi:hypothetical protein